MLITSFFACATKDLISALSDSETEMPLSIASAVDERRSCKDRCVSMVPWIRAIGASRTDCR